MPDNFDCFENQALARRNGLSYFLKHVNFMHKLRNTNSLRLIRRGQRSSWRLVPPAAPAP